MDNTIRKRIITVAVTGAWPMKTDNPNVPIEPIEIARDVISCAKAGAAIAHIHCRDDQGKPAMNFEKFKETVSLIRKSGCDIILNLTTSGGVDIDENERVRPFCELKPEIATYDCGTMNWQHKVVFENNPTFLERLGRLMKQHGVKPEIEIFDVGMIYNAAYYLNKGILTLPLHFQFCLGVKGGIAANTKNLLFLYETMQHEIGISTWSAFGVGSSSMEILYSTISLGGHIRVGMEDSVYYHRGILAKSNVQFVERAKRCIEEYGCGVATPNEAREVLGL